MDKVNTIVIDLWNEQLSKILRVYMQQAVESLDVSDLLVLQDMVNKELMKRLMELKK